MPNHDKKLKSDFDQAVAGTAYYSIFTIEPAPDEPGKWDVLFFVSGAKDDVEVTSPLSARELHRLLNTYYAFAADRPQFEGELSRNLHMGRVDSKERAERLACELVYIFKDAGMEPMKDERSVFVPMAPETSRPLLPPPRKPKP